MRTFFSSRLSFFLIVISVLSSLIIYIYSPLVVPIGFSLFFSYLLHPFVEKGYAKGLPRVIASGLFVLITLISLSLLFFIFLPLLYQEVLSLINLAPKAFAVVSEKWLPSIKEYLVSLKLLTAGEFNRVVSDFSQLSNVMQNFYKALTTIWYTVPALMHFLLNIVLVPLLSFFLLNHLHAIKASLVKIVPKFLSKSLIIGAQQVDLTLKTVIKGQFVVACILGILYMTSFSLIGMESALVIGFISGVCRLVPYLDIVVGGTLSLIVILSNAQGTSILVAVFVSFFVIQTVDGLFITPRVIGKKAGLHPGVVILSVLAFGQLLGFWGVLLAIPIVAVIKDLVRLLLPHYFQSAYYNDTGDY